jgi:hypothetical protein
MVAAMFKVQFIARLAIPYHWPAFGNSTSSQRRGRLEQNRALKLARKSSVQKEIDQMILFAPSDWDNIKVVENVHGGLRIFFRVRDLARPLLSTSPQR